MVHPRRNRSHTPVNGQMPCARCPLIVITDETELRRLAHFEEDEDQKRPLI